MSTDPTQQHLRSWQYESRQTPRISRLVSRPVAMKSTAFLMSNYPKRVAKNFEKNFLKRRNLILWSNVSRLQVPVICIGKDIILVLIVLLWNQQVDGEVLVIMICRKLWNGWNGWSIHFEKKNATVVYPPEGKIAWHMQGIAGNTRSWHPRVCVTWMVSTLWPRPCTSFLAVYGMVVLAAV